MRVGVDGRSLVGGGARGVAHYTVALLGALAAGFPADEWRVLLPRGPAPELPPGVEPISAALPGRVLHGAAAVARRPRADRLLGGGLDVLWLPAPAPVAVSAGVPLALTVHDLSWEARPQDFTHYERAWHRAARPRTLARRAARILCPTEAVRREVIAAWGLEPERVRAIHHGPGMAATAAAPPRIRAEVPPYLVFVGALEPRKAPDVLGAAFAAARGQGLEAELWVAGEGRLAAGLDRPGIRRLGHLADAALPGLYAGALALVLPSLLEGFGLPPVEALTHGTPVIASDLPVLREVLSDRGALFVAPGDAGALAAAMLRMERDPGLRARLLAAGRAAIAPLSWEAAARETRASLAEAAAGA